MITQAAASAHGPSALATVAAAGASRRPAEAVLWNGAGVGGRQLIQLAATIILARALAPEHFGAVGMVVVVTAFLAAAADLGLGVALVQQPGLLQRQLDAAFWLTAGAGVLLGGIMWAAAPAVAGFYGEAVLAPITRAMSLQLMLAGAGVVPRAVLVRAVRFRALALIELTTGIIAAGVGITLALTGAGVWSLVAMLLTATGTNALLYAGAARWRPTSFAGPRELTSMASFARNLVAFRAVNYWARNADDLLVGRFLGAGPLGTYGLAYQFIMLPLQQVSTVIGDVMLPVMARCREDAAQVRLAFLRALQAVALILFPVMVGIFIVAAEAVPVLLGEQWRDAVPVVRILAVAGGAQALGVSVGWIYQSQGRSDVMFRWGVFAAVVALAGVIIGLPWGLPGVAAGYTAAVVLLTPVSHLVAGRLIGLRLRDIVVEVRSAAAAVLFMAIIAVTVRTALHSAGLSPGPVLAGTVISGVVSYTSAVALLRPPSLDVLWPAVRRLLRMPRT